MLITVHNVNMRVNADGKVVYARGTRSNRFISHRTAQMLYDDAQTTTLLRAQRAAAAKRAAKAAVLAERLEAAAIVSIAVIINIIAVLVLMA